jgi:hypothetical protein
VKRLVFQFSERSEFWSSVAIGAFLGSLAAFALRRPDFLLRFFESLPHAVVALVVLFSLALLLAGLWCLAFAKRPPAPLAGLFLILWIVLLVAVDDSSTDGPQSGRTWRAFGIILVSSVFLFAIVWRLMSALPS